MSEMPETSNPIKIIGNIFVIAYPLLILFHLVWLLSTSKIIYWDGHNAVNGLVIFLIVLTFVPFAISLFISDLHTGWRLLASLFVFPLLCISAFFWLDLPFYSQVNEMRFNEHKYLLAHHNSIYGDGDVYEWYLFECTSTGIFCKPTLLYTDEFGELYDDPISSNFIVDEQAHELHVFVEDGLIYTVGYPSRKYIQMLPDARRGEYTYNLSKYEDLPADSVVYNLYECDRQYTCTSVPFVYSLPRERAARILRFSVVIDERTSEVQVLRQFKREGVELIFSYGEQPRCFVDGCSIPEE